MGTGNRCSEFGGKEICGEVKYNGHADVRKGAVIKKKEENDQTKNSSELTSVGMASNIAIHMTNYYTSCPVLSF